MPYVELEGAVHDQVVERGEILGVVVHGGLEKKYRITS